MKNIKFTLLSVFTVLFLFSCSSDDNGGGIDTNLLLGKWYIYSFVENDEEELHQNECEDRRDYVHFKNGGVAESIYNELDYLDGECNTYIDLATYTVSGDKINIVYEDEDENAESFSWTIITLNQTTLLVEEKNGGDIFRIKFTRE